MRHHGHREYIELIENLPYEIDPGFSNFRKGTTHIEFRMGGRFVERRTMVHGVWTKWLSSYSTPDDLGYQSRLILPLLPPSEADIEALI